jgi:hypothetical protein
MHFRKLWNAIGHFPRHAIGLAHLAFDHDEYGAHGLGPPEIAFMLEYLRAKWNHLAPRKTISNKGVVWFP